MWMSWEDGSAVKECFLLLQGIGFYFQDLDSGSQSPMTPVPRLPMPSADLLGNQEGYGALVYT